MNINSLINIINISSLFFMLSSVYADDYSKQCCSGDTYHCCESSNGTSSWSEHGCKSNSSTSCSVEQGCIWGACNNN